MTEQEIMQLVEEAGMFALIGPSSNLLYHEIVSLQRFANLVAEREREAGAVTAWNHYMDECRRKNVHPADFGEWSAAAAIRARGEKES